MTPKKKRFDPTVTRAIVKVGNGRGFIVGYRMELPRFRGRRIFDHRRLVVTAGHCLPTLPRAFSADSSHLRTYRDLLGRLEAEKPTVWAECLFVDPVADLAVLGSPDTQELYEQAEAYGELTISVRPLEVGKAPRKAQGWLFSLDGRWSACTVGSCSSAKSLWMERES